MAEESGLSDRYIRSLESETAQQSASALSRLSLALEMTMDEAAIGENDEN